MTHLFQSVYTVDLYFEVILGVANVGESVSRNKPKD